MDFKQMTATVSKLITSPAIAWKAISHSESRAAMFNAYLYPLIMLCCLSAFLGNLMNCEFGFDSFYNAMVKTGVLFATLFLTYHLTACLVAKISATLMHAEYDRKQTDLLAGYSMVVVLLLDLCLGVFPDFRIIGWILQFYTVKIVWDGAAVLMRIPEDRRLSYTMLVSLTVIVAPIAIGTIMSKLSANFG